MSTTSLPRVPLGTDLERTQIIINQLLEELDWLLNGMIDSKNVRNIAGYNVSDTELKHKSGIVGMSGADQKNPEAIRFWAGDAIDGDPNYKVTQAGILTAVAAMIMSKRTGYPRTSFNQEGVFKAESSATDYVQISYDSDGKAIFNIVSGSLNFMIREVLGKITLLTGNGGDMQISSGGDLELYASSIDSSSVVRTNSWSRFVNDQGRSLQSELNALSQSISNITPTITSGTYPVVTYNNYGAATGGRALTTNDIPSGIPAGKIEDGTVSSTQFRYLNNVNADIQTQLNGKAVKTPTISWSSATSMLLNGWANYSSSLFDTPAFYKDQFNYVHLRGMIQAGTVTNGTNILQLPAGYRPLKHRYKTAVSNSNTCTVAILSTGELQIAGNVSSWLSLDSIEPFLAEQ